VDNPGKGTCPGVPRVGVGKGEIELGNGWPFPSRTGFTPIIGPFAHLSTILGWVEGGECSLGGSVCPDNGTGGWGDGDLGSDDWTDPGGRRRGPAPGGASVVGERGGRSRLVGECFVDNAGPEETVEDFGESGLTISVLGMGTGCLSSLTAAVVILARLGFLARSLVGYNAGEQI